MSVTFHHLEDYNTSERSSNLMVVCSFDTERFGYLQVRLTRRAKGTRYESNKAWKFESLQNEPDLNMFSSSDIEHMNKICHIIWRMLYDTPAATERFR